MTQQLCGNKGWYNHCFKIVVIRKVKASGIVFNFLGKETFRKRVIFSVQVGPVIAGLRPGEHFFLSPSHSLQRRIGLKSTSMHEILYFVDRASRYKFLVITNLTHFFHVVIYFMSLHVSSVTVLIIRRSNCINTSSGMISLCK